MLFLFASGLQSLSPSLSAAIELCILWHRHAAACRGRCLKLKAGMRFDLGHRFSTGRSSARMGMPSYQWPNQLYKARRRIQILSYIGTLLLDVERYANHFSMQQKKRSRAGYKEPEYLIQTTHSGQLVSCVNTRSSTLTRQQFQNHGPASCTNQSPAGPSSCKSSALTPFHTTPSSLNNCRSRQK